MLIYRVEDENRRGPFALRNAKDSTYGWFRYETWEDENHPDRHPSPRQDGITRTDEDLCGCLSLDQLRKWFPVPYSWDLAIHNFVIGVYSVPDSNVKRGQLQVCFHRYACQRVDELPLTTIII